MPSYTAKDITVLEGLEPVRKRPGMYIGGVGSTGLHHLVWEILDNAVDEAMNGHASSISVTLHADGSSITITDDGRGIPVDKHPQSKKSALEVVFTVLHAGGKFEHGSYKTAGGLHGVGASVVCALSKELVVTVKRDGALWEQRFKQGDPAGRREEARRRPGAPGTTVFFRPDATIFPKVEFDAAVIRERLEVASYLHRGVKVVVRGRGGEDARGLRARRRHRGVPEDAGRRREPAAGARVAVRAGPRQRPARSIWRCSGPSRPTSRSAATSTASRPGRAARTRTGCARASARRCATSSRRTT